MLPAALISVRADRNSPAVKMPLNKAAIRTLVENGELDLATAEYKYREGWQPLNELLNPPKPQPARPAAPVSRLSENANSCMTTGCAVLVMGAFLYVAGAIIYHYSVMSPGVVSALPSMLRPEAARYGYVKGLFAGKLYGANHREPPTVIELDEILTQQLPERSPQFDQEQWSAGYKAGFEAGFHEVKQKAF